MAARIEIIATTMRSSMSVKAGPDRGVERRIENAIMGFPADRRIGPRNNENETNSHKYHRQAQSRALADYFALFFELLNV